MAHRTINDVRTGPTNIRRKVKFAFPSRAIASLSLCEFPPSRCFLIVKNSLTSKKRISNPSNSMLESVP